MKPEDDEPEEETPEWGCCRECLEEGPLNDGVCEDCDREECPTCEGTGYDPNHEPDPNDEDDDDVCQDCGGDGVI